MMAIYFSIFLVAVASLFTVTYGFFTGKLVSTTSMKITARKSPINALKASVSEVLGCPLCQGNAGKLV